VCTYKQQYTWHSNLVALFKTHNHTKTRIYDKLSNFYGPALIEDFSAPRGNDLRKNMSFMTSGNLCSNMPGMPTNVTIKHPIVKDASKTLIHVILIDFQSERYSININYDKKFNIYKDLTLKLVDVRERHIYPTVVTIKKDKNFVTMNKEWKNGNDDTSRDKYPAEITYRINATTGKKVITRYAYKQGKNFVRLNNPNNKLPTIAEFHSSGKPKKYEWYILIQSPYLAHRNDLTSMKHDDDAPSSIEYYATGIKKEERYYQNNKLGRAHGPAIIEYYQSGNIKTEKYYDHGRKYRFGQNSMPVLIMYNEKGRIIGREYVSSKSIGTTIKFGYYCVSKNCQCYKNIAIMKKDIENKADDKDEDTGIKKKKLSLVWMYHNKCKALANVPKKSKFKTKEKLDFNTAYTEVESQSASINYLYASKIDLTMRSIVHNTIFVNNNILNDEDIRYPSINYLKFCGAVENIYYSYSSGKIIHEDYVKLINKEFIKYKLGLWHNPDLYKDKPIQNIKDDIISLKRFVDISARTEVRKVEKTSKTAKTKKR
jgi:hypothetical protein